MEFMQRHNLPESLESVITHFAKELESFKDYEFVGDVRTQGFVGAIEFVKDKKTKTPFDIRERFAFNLCRKALNSGLIIRPLGDVIYFMPPYIITEDQLDNILYLTHKAVKEMTHEYTNS